MKLSEILVELESKLNSFLSKPLYAKVRDIDSHRAMVIIYKRRKLWLPKPVAFVRGSKVYLADNRFYDQVKSVALKANMIIVLD